MRSKPSKLATGVRKRRSQNDPSCLLIQANNRQTGVGRSRARVKASRNSQSDGSPGFSDTVKTDGTALAFKGKNIGRAVTRPSVVIPRGRRSTELRRRDVENILAAGVFTLGKHRRLNRFTTIHFEAAKLSDPVQAIGRMMKLAADWLRTQGEVLSYIWVREAGDGKGDHVHILWSVPPDLSKDFARLECGWRKLMGAKRGKRAFKSKPVGLSYKHGAYEIQHGQAYSEALSGVLSYMVKGAGPKTAKALGLQQSGLGGELWGKRCGMSENINRTARARALK